MLRLSVLDELRARLSVPPYLHPDDFTFETKPEKSSETLTVKYVGTESIFVASIPRSKTKGEYRSDFDIDCVVNPGEITTNEKFSVFGLSNLQDAVANWAGRIAKDLERAPVMRAVKRNADRVAELEKQLETLADDEYATPEQLESMRTWLSETERQLREKLEALTIDAKEKQARLDALAAEFAFMRERVEGANLKNALRVIAVRFYRAATDPQISALLANGASIAQLTALIK